MLLAFLFTRLKHSIKAHIDLTKLVQNCKLMRPFKIYKQFWNHINFLVKCMSTLIVRKCCDFYSTLCFNFISTHAVKSNSSMNTVQTNSRNKWSFYFISKYLCHVNYPANGSATFRRLEKLYSILENNSL